MSEEIKDELRSSEHDFELSQNENYIENKMNQTSIEPFFFSKVNHNQRISKFDRHR